MYKKGRVNSNSRNISTDEDPSLRIESSAIINLRGVSTKLNKYIVFTMQTYKKLINCNMSVMSKKFCYLSVPRACYLSLINYFMISLHFCLVYKSLKTGLSKHVI